ncbi:hypothetical protein BD779DRAFT_1679264 [Infundibulicybe gibba]|nr:hypothetical protein BD779DRAFT_1679264 [Infundibulicybe gibba]
MAIVAIVVCCFTDAPSYSTLGALIPHAHRWEQVYFRLGPNSNSALAPVKARLQSLKRLRLSFDCVTGTVDFCEVAPQLTEIWLEMISKPIVITLPWEQLRLCTLDNTGIALYLFQQAKNIQKCHLKHCDLYPHWLSIPRGPHSHHLALDTLVIDEWRHSDNHTMSSFFSSLTLPSLRVLDIHFPHLMHFPKDEDNDSDSESDDGSIDGPQFGSTFLKFIERSAVHLNELRLIRFPSSPSQFIDCLTLTQSLVSLDIQYDHYDDHWDWTLHREINDEILHALSANLPGPILPCLRSLTLRGRCLFLEESLDAVVTSRRDINPMDVHRIALLENLILDCSTPIGWPSEPCRPPSFHRFVPRGLNIEYGRSWRIHDPAGDL